MTAYSDPTGAGSYGPLDTTTSSATWLYGSSGSPSVFAVNPVSANLASDKPINLGSEE
jgi:hypothetical protein